MVQPILAINRAERAMVDPGCGGAILFQSIVKAFVEVATESRYNMFMDNSVDASVITLAEVVERRTDTYLNQIVATMNDAVVRVSVMTEPYFWHLHPNSDETFVVLEGRLGVEFGRSEIILDAGQILTIPKGVVHRTRPVGGQSLNLTVESADTTTERCNPFLGTSS